MKDDDEPSVTKVDVGLFMTELDDKPSLIKDWDEPSLINDDVLVNPGVRGGIFGLVKKEESANEESVKEDSTVLILLSKIRKFNTIEPSQDAVEICYKHALTFTYTTAF